MNAADETRFRALENKVDFLMEHNHEIGSIGSEALFSGGPSQLPAAPPVQQPYLSEPVNVLPEEIEDANNIDRRQHDSPEQ